MPVEPAPREVTKGPTIQVEVVYALPLRAWSVTLELPARATVADALALTRFTVLVPEFDPGQLAYAVFGRPISANTELRDGDRLELLRQLIADPKQARRRRARGDGA